MIYLAQCEDGKYLVEAQDWNNAVETLRLAMTKTWKREPVMICAFADEVRGVRQVMNSFHWTPAFSNDSLAQVIVEYGQACVELSWLGSKDAESHDEIRNDYAAAKQAVEKLIIAKLPE